MKTFTCVALSLIAVSVLTSAKPLEKLIIGKWYNPNSYEMGDIRGFQFRKNGTCRCFNVPELKLESWKIVNGKLIIRGKLYDEKGGVELYETEEPIDRLTRDSLVTVAREKSPRLVFEYVKKRLLKSQKPKTTK